MFDINNYLQNLITACISAFADRLLYVGLQGSYLRGEANAESDIDVMIVIDGLIVRDMDVYREILQQVGDYERSCGFICGKDEILRWNPLEVCQLKYTTKDLYGTLSAFLPESSRADEINYVKLSLGNLYHELCHRYIHADLEKNKNRFRSACKGFFYLIQNLYYLESGTFIATKRELKTVVCDDDRMMLAMSELPDDFDFGKAFDFVFAWCQTAFRRIDGIKP